jgi:hypothetical protein
VINGHTPGTSVDVDARPRHGAGDGVAEIVVL